jgi:hypothetical protein
MQNEKIQPDLATAAYGIQVIGYAPSTLKQPLSLVQRLAVAILVIGLLLYVLVCIPSYSRSWWPPIDRLWEAPPWLWLFPIPMFTLVMPGGWFSRKLLIGYALLTSVVDAWTFPFANMNPHVDMDTRLWLMNLQMTIPLHLVLTAVVAPLSRLAYHVFQISSPTGTIPQPLAVRLARFIVFSGILGAAAIFPFVYRSWMTSSDAAEGAKMADVAWAKGKATVISNDDAVYREVGNFNFASFFDPDLGFPIHHSWYGRWELGYNAEIRRLVKSRGLPVWSLKSRFVSDEDMVTMLKSTDLKHVTSYPCILSPQLVLLRGSGATPWGTSVNNGNKYLAIESFNQQDEIPPMGPLGEENDPAFVGTLAKYPGTFFVRCGASMVACTADGWIVQYVID